MSFSLGIDTGGTYTDAVIFDAATETLIAKAKALTTRHDLAIGIAEAAGRALEAAAVDAGTIGLVSLSTTLATNALVEGQGGRVALVMIGFGESDLDKAGLRAALGDDPVVFAPGGHDTHGRAAPLDLAPLEALLDGHGDQVSAFAVAGYFAVRNPEHEQAARQLIRAHTGLPVTCSHELTSRLDGPRRALTTLLNARLIGLIDRLIGATRRFLSDRGVGAPLMVVRGDGSLVSADFAMMRPIETILSGPAASLVGARVLTGRDDAHVADIGGTTTDIALLAAGRPMIDPGGALVGGHATMVEAVAVRTIGLGGDSEVSYQEGALDPQIHLGPRRVMSLSLAETLYPGRIVPHLKRQSDAPLADRHDGRFALLTGVRDRSSGGLSRSQADLLGRLSEFPQPLAALLRSTAERATLDRLVARGLALSCGFTPSDAQHVLGRFDHWNREAAQLGAALFARRKNGYGRPLGETPEALARLVVARLQRLSAEHLLEAALAADGVAGEGLAQSPIVRRALDRKGALVRAALILDRPVIGLGAGAGTYYPAVGALLGTEAIVPDNADVANAIGAVAGQVRVTVTAQIAPADADEAFIVTGPLSARYADEASALAAARDACRALARKRACEAGAADVSVHDGETIDAPVVDGVRRFVAATVTATAVGRPASR